MRHKKIVTSLTCGARVSMLSHRPSLGIVHWGLLQTSTHIGGEQSLVDHMVHIERKSESEYESECS